MPAELFGRDFAFLPRELLTFEEIARLAGHRRPPGREKVRLTGGEPLVRRDLPVLVADAGSLGRRRGPRPDAHHQRRPLLRPLASALREAGLQRITVSLDSLTMRCSAR